MPQFRSSGVQDVDSHVTYAPKNPALAESRRTGSSREHKAAQRRSGRHSAATQQDAAAQAANVDPKPSSTPASAVAKHNVGYRLLKQAGWSEGQGLGANEDGRTQPVLPTPQKGNQGLGFNPNDPIAQQQKQSRKRRVREAAAADAGEQQQQPVVLQGPRGRSAQHIAALVDAELKAEPVEVKVARYKQVDRQEAEDKKMRAIRQYLHRAFNDPSTEETADRNPLLRSSRLTASNPLLD